MNGDFQLARARVGVLDVHREPGPPARRGARSPLCVKRERGPSSRWIQLTK